MTDYEADRNGRSDQWPGDDPQHVWTMPWATVVTPEADRDDYRDSDERIRLRCDWARDDSPCARPVNHEGPCDYEDRDER